MNVKLELYRGQATETVLSTGTYSSITEAHDAALHAIRRLWRVPGQVRWRIRDFDSGRILGEGGSNDPAPLPPKITASAAFLDERNAIADVLNRLASLCDDHFGVVPDDVTWADVGSLEHYREGLEAVAACAFQEHAAPGEEVEA